MPNRGPVDDQYLGMIVRAVNDLTNSVAKTTYNYTIINTKEAGKQSIPTNQAMIFGGTVNVTSNETVVKDTSKPFYVDLPPGFKYAPNVQVSIVNAGTSNVGNMASAKITNVTKSRIDGVVVFGMSGAASIAVSITAVGIPE